MDPTNPDNDSSNPNANANANANADSSRKRDRDHDIDQVAADQVAALLTKIEPRWCQRRSLPYTRMQKLLPLNLFSK
jgi:hypothetical protein